MIAIYGDLHIDEPSIPEIKEIFEEIYFNQDFQRVVFLGDIFNKKKPTPTEVDFFTWLVVNMLKKGAVDIVVGNHDESTTKSSALDYVKHLGVTIHKGESCALLGNFKLGIGHFFTDKGDEFYKDETHKVSDLSKKYDFTLLGHDHRFKKLAENVYHLGSVRRKSFNELEYGLPKYAILAPESGKVDFCEIKSAIPMYEVNSIEEALKTNSRAKLRLVFTSFNSYLSSINKLQELNNRFEAFKIKHDYTQKIEKKDTTIQKGRSFSDIFAKFLKETVKNDRVKSLIEESLDE